MPAATYLYERQTEYWTSRQIEDFFFDRGMEVITLPIPQTAEYFLPADFVFSATSFVKIFGLQYKALYHNAEDHWRITEDQHLQLRLYSWIYYCLSEMKEAIEHRSALHWCRFADWDFAFQPKLYFNGSSRFKHYRKWAAFYEDLRRCRKGARITSRQQLKDLLMAGQDDPQLVRLTDVVTSIFVVDFEKKKTVHYSSLLKNIENREQEIG